MIGTVGVATDALFGEPPASVHPVRAFGGLMKAVERRLYGDSRAAGTVYTAIGLGVGLSSGLIIRRPIATYVAVAGRSLWDEATAIAFVLDRGNLDAARDRLPALVGRDPTGLDEKEIARAVVESVAENTVDAIVAPTLWGRAGLALAYRAVNTMDAVVGHRSQRYERFGWASARLDDAANWVPARVTAAVVAGLRPPKAREVWRAVKEDAPRHPSPNAGVAEAAFAAALELRLGGPNRYGDRIELRPALGAGRPAETVDIGRAVMLSKQVAAVVAVLA